MINKNTFHVFSLSTSFLFASLHRPGFAGILCQSNISAWCCRVKSDGPNELPTLPAMCLWRSSGGDWHVGPPPCRSPEAIMSEVRPCEEVERWDQNVTVVHAALRPRSIGLCDCSPPGRGGTQSRKGYRLPRSWGCREQKLLKRTDCPVIMNLQRELSNLLI